MTKFGWDDTQPLGTGNDDDAITEPVEANGQNTKRGFGYHGEKIAAPSVNLTEKDVKRLTRTPVVNGSEPQHRIVEPLASHSYMFPQYHNNLTLGSRSYKERSARQRKRATPGTDGIVLSTVYDEELDVDIIAKRRYIVPRNRPRLKNGGL